MKSKMFNRLNHITDQLYEVDLANPELEHREPISDGLFILRCTKLRLLELTGDFFKTFCDSSKIEQLEVITDSLYLAMSGGILGDIGLARKSDDRRRLPSEDCTGVFTGNATYYFFSRTSSISHKKHNKREAGLLKEGFRCSKMLSFHHNDLLL